MTIAQLRSEYCLDESSLFLCSCFGSSLVKELIIVAMLANKSFNKCLTILAGRTCDLSLIKIFRFRFYIIHLVDALDVVGIYR